MRELTSTDIARAVAGPLGWAVEEGGRGDVAYIVGPGAPRGGRLRIRVQGGRILIAGEFPKRGPGGTDYCPHGKTFEITVSKDRASTPAALAREVERRLLRPYLLALASAFGRRAIDLASHVRKLEILARLERTGLIEEATGWQGRVAASGTRYMRGFALPDGGEGELEVEGVVLGWEGMTLRLTTLDLDLAESILIAVREKTLEHARNGVDEIAPEALRDEPELAVKYRACAAAGCNTRVRPPRTYCRACDADPRLPRGWAIVKAAQLGPGEYLVRRDESSAFDSDEAAVKANFMEWRLVDGTSGVVARRPFTMAAKVQAAIHDHELA